MTLANILSLSSSLDTTSHLDDSEQPHDSGISIDQVLAESPLSCLVHALRARNGHIYQPDHPLSEAALLSQLRDLVDAIAPSLDSQDATLAQAIVVLLLDFEQLPASLALTSAQLVSRSESFQDNEIGTASFLESPYAIIASLQRQLSSLQPSGASAPSGSRPTPEESVRTALLWARIDQQLETVVSLCRARASSPPQRELTEPSVTQPPESRRWYNDYRSSFDDALPPDYECEYNHSPLERPPSYVADGNLYAFSGDKPTDDKHLAEQYPPEKVSPRVSTSRLLGDTEITTEHDHTISSHSLDLDRITHAIERLYVVTPQLANQRVELRKEKVMQMERAKQGKGKARTFGDAADPELDKILDLLGRASAREIPDQSVVVDPRRIAREVGAADLEEQVRSLSW